MATKTIAVRKTKTPRQKTIAKLASKKKQVAADLSKSYNEYKNFEGQQYSGMKVGRSHKWYYDKGEWKETKITPDLWEISYAVTKRRAGKAPEGSGVPVGRISLVHSCSSEREKDECKWLYHFNDRIKI